MEAILLGLEGKPMLNLVDHPSTPESRLAAASILGNSLSLQTRRRRTVFRVLCSSSPPAREFPTQKVAVNNVQRPTSAAEHIQSIRTRAQSSKTITRAASLSSPLFFSDEGQNGAPPKRAQNGAATNRSTRVEVSAKGKWHKKHDSSLSEDEPLPLPMTWPDSQPSSKEKIDDMLSCNPEEQNCKDIVYQWTGDCKSCQGTGLVSIYRKRQEVVSKCINCLGIGSVHKITSRADIQNMDGTNGSSNGSANGSARSNGKA